MNQFPSTRGALLAGAAGALLTLATSAAFAQTYPPGTNCQSLLPGLRAACVEQARRLNSGAAVNGNNAVIPNSGGSHTVPTPGTGMPSTTTGMPNTTTGMPNTTTGMPNTVTPNGTVSPNAVTPNGTVSPNAVTPNGTVSPNTVTPNGTVNPNAVGTPNSANPVIVPPASGSTGGGTN